MSIFDITARSPLYFIIPLAVGLAGLVPFLIWAIRNIRAEKKAAKVQSDFLAWYNTFSLDEIWQISDRNRFFIAMYRWLARKYEKQRKSDGIECVLSSAENTVLDVITFEFHAYFYGLYDFWLCYGAEKIADGYEASLREIGATGAAELWHDAVSLINSSTGNPLDPKLDDPELARGLSVLDFGYSTQSDKIKDLLYQYILLHKSEFSE